MILVYSSIWIAPECAHSPPEKPCKLLRQSLY